MPKAHSSVAEDVIEQQATHEIAQSGLKWYEDDPYKSLTTRFRGPDKHPITTVMNRQAAARVKKSRQRNHRHGSENHRLLHDMTIRKTYLTPREDLRCELCPIGHK